MFASYIKLFLLLYASLANIQLYSSFAKGCWFSLWIYYKMNINYILYSRIFIIIIPQINLYRPHQPLILCPFYSRFCKYSVVIFFGK